MCRVVQCLLYFVEVVVKSLAEDPVFFHRLLDTDVRVALSLFRPALTIDMAQADVQCWAPTPAVGRLFLPYLPCD